MNRFEYIGNTEAGCYLGGIVIRSNNAWPPIGPLCGEVGRLIFEDKRLDGVTLSSHKASLIIFLYSGQNSKLLLDITFSSDQCQGIQNIRDYNPVHDPYEARRIPRGLFRIGLHPESHRKPLAPSLIETRYSVGLWSTGNVHKCLKMQNFIDSFVTNSRTINTNFELYCSIFNLVNAEIKMVRHEGPCRISNAVPYIISLKLETKSDSVTINTTNTTYISKPSLLIDDSAFTVTTLHDITCATVYDGVSEIIFHLLEKRCSEDVLSIHHSANISFIPDYATAKAKCSSATVGLSDGVYGKRFLWTYLNQVHIQVSIPHALNHCPARDIYIVITLTYLKQARGTIYQFSYSYIYI